LKEIINSDYAEDEFEISFNQIENDDLDSSESEQDHTSQAEVNVPTKECDLILELINNLNDSDHKKHYLEQFKKAVDKPSTSSSHIFSHPQVTNTYNITDIPNRFPSKISKDITIQDLQYE